jgi:hypothetical protein
MPPIAIQINSSINVNPLAFILVFPCSNLDCFSESEDIQEILQAD